MPFSIVTGIFMFQIVRKKRFFLLLYIKVYMTRKFLSVIRWLGKCNKRIET